MADTDSLLAEALQAIKESSDEKSLDSLRVQYLGKKGSLTALLKNLGKLPAEERPAAGESINVAKRQLQNAIDARQKSIIESSLNEQLIRDAIDVTLPGRRQSQGGLHPITITMDRITAIFESAGYDVAEGPEIEDEYYNFKHSKPSSCQSHARYFLCESWHRIENSYITGTSTRDGKRTATISNGLPREGLSL